MATKKKSVHIYCAVYGCLNVKRDDNISFFTLPTTNERRNEWLTRIDRHDLLSNADLKPTSYRVCSIHFDESMITSVYTRKLLPEAVPTKFLTNTQPSTSEYENGSENAKSSDFDVSTQTNSTSININNGSETTTGTQTENPQEKTAQSSALSSNTARMRKLNAQLRVYKNKTKMLQRELKKLKQDIGTKNSLSLCSKCKTSF